MVVPTHVDAKMHELGEYVVLEVMFQVRSRFIYLQMIHID